MMLVVGSATEASPLITPPPADAVNTPAPTPYVTQVPTAVPTAVPTLEPTATPVAYTTLYVGDRGEDVRKLQRRLTELGYLNDKIDGIYGQNTRRAVERFQFYNSLTVDGVAGKATQAALYENPRVVTAPPDITPGPTFTPAPPRGVTVPVYYVDENNRLLNRVDMVCYGDTTIFANSNNVGANYSLVSSSPVKVTVSGGVASPSSVIFRYQLNVSPAPTAETVNVPVYYMMHQTSVSLTRGATTYVSANPALVPSFYQLASQSPVAVTVTGQGTPSPATVVFTFRNATPTEAPAPRQVSVPVRYVNESGFLLNESTVTIDYGATVAVYAGMGMVQEDYRLISQSPVSVTVSQTGSPAPAVVIFTYAFQAPATEAPTQAPTQVPTEIPTQVPTEAPTQAPTEVPTQAPTEEPTQAPTEEPTQAPTEEPTQAPTEEPTQAPTEEPTQAPTEEPTQAPTEEPTQAPTEEPTQAPTEEPTQAPTEEPTQPPAPSSEPLTEAGNAVTLNETPLQLTWYQDQNGNAMISLRALANAAGWEYAPNRVSILLGHMLDVYYDVNGVSTLTVDGQFLAAEGLVWRGDLFVSAALLQALGIQAQASGGQLVLTYSQQ